MKYIAMAAAALLVTQPVLAQDDDDGGNLTQIYWFDIKHGHGSDFNEGMKAYWACVAENGGERGWGAWRPATGNLDGVMFRSGGNEWADFDAESPVGDACEEAWDTGVQPHTTGVYSGMVAMTDYTHVAEGMNPTVVMEILYDVSNTTEAWDLIKEMHTAFEGKDWYSYEWFSRIAMPGKWDMSVAVLSENWAGMGPQDQNFWEIVEEKHGKKKAESLREKWNAIVLDTRTNVYTRARNISYSPESSDDS